MTASFSKSRKGISPYMFVGADINMELGTIQLAAWLIPFKTQEATKTSSLVVVSADYTWPRHYSACSQSYTLAVCISILCTCNSDDSDAQVLRLRSGTTCECYASAAERRASVTPQRRHDNSNTVSVLLQLWLLRQNLQLPWKLSPREAEGFSVQLFGLSVCLSHSWRGPLRHVCGHTNHRTTMIHTCLESLSNLQ